MWRATIFAVAVALLPGACAGNVDREEAALQRKLWEMEGQLWETEQEEHHHVHHVHRHRRVPLLGLLRRRGVVTSAPDAKGSPHGHAASRTLPSNHPAMRNLESRQHAAKDARLNLEGNVNDAMEHLNSVGVIKSQMAKTQVQIRVEERKLQKLEDDLKRLDMTHSSLSQSLRRIMEPKLAYAQERMLKTERKVHKLETRDAEWKQSADKFHAASLAMLKERGQSKANLEAALVGEERAHQERVAAEKHFGAAKRETEYDVGNYRYSSTEERAAKNKEKRGEEEMRRAKAATKRLSNILQAEQSRVDESMAVGKDRVQGKVQELENAKKKSNEKLAELKSEYAAWQDQQQTWHTRLASVEDGTAAASRDYADAQEAAFAAQRERVLRDAEHATDWAWDEWPGPGSENKADAP